MAKCPACDYPYAQKGYYHTEGIVGVKKNVLRCPNCGYEEESGPCFIATTVYGNYDHPVVFDLRNFRDNWLKKREKGKIFINWYYKNGPILASWVDKSETRKLLALILIIKPLHLLVKIFRLHK